MHKAVSIICASETSTLETVALRGVLEYFGYTSSVHWVGSVEQFKDILAGKTKLSAMVVLSCHGTKKGFLGTDNTVIPLQDIPVRLAGKKILSLGCVTGMQQFAKKFISGGVKQYIAPPAYPEGNSALMFASMFFWQLQRTKNTTKSWQEASAILKDTEDRFHSYQKIKNGMSVDGDREIPL